MLSGACRVHRARALGCVPGASCSWLAGCTARGCGFSSAWRRLCLGLGPLAWLLSQASTRSPAGGTRPLRCTPTRLRGSGASPPPSISVSAFQDSGPSPLRASAGWLAPAAQPSASAGCAALAPALDRARCGGRRAWCGRSKVCGQLVWAGASKAWVVRVSHAYAVHGGLVLLHGAQHHAALRRHAPYPHRPVEPPAHLPTRKHHYRFVYVTGFSTIIDMYL